MKTTDEAPARPQHAYRGTLGLYWPTKGIGGHLLYDNTGHITSAVDLARKPSPGTSAGPRLAIPTRAGSLPLGRVLRARESPSILLFGPHELGLRALLRAFRRVPESRRVQCAIYAPPLVVQSPVHGTCSRADVLDLTARCLRGLRQVTREDGFILSHLVEPLYASAKIVHDEVLGRSNHLATIVWQKWDERPAWVPGDVAPFDLILVYARDIDRARVGSFPPTDRLYRNPDDDARGKWESRPLVASEKSSNKRYTYTFKNGLRLTRKWRYSRETLSRYEAEDRIYFTNPRHGQGIPRLKKFFRERMARYARTGKGGRTANSLWTNPAKCGTLVGAVREVFGEEEETASGSPGNTTRAYARMPFRPVQLYERLFTLFARAERTVLDVFGQYGQVYRAAENAGCRWIGIVASTRRHERCFPHEDRDQLVSYQLSRPLVHEASLNPDIPRAVISPGLLQLLDYGSLQRVELSSGEVYTGVRGSRAGILYLAFPPTFLPPAPFQALLQEVDVQFDLARFAHVDFLTNCGVLGATPGVKKGVPAFISVRKLPQAIMEGNIHS